MMIKNQLSYLFQIIPSGFSLVRQKRVVFLFTIVLGFVSSPAYSLSFAEAYQRLLEKNLSYQRAKLDYQADKALVAQARARLLPSVDVIGAKGYIQDNTLNLENEEATASQTENEEEIDLSLEEREREELSIRLLQPIYNRNLSMQYRQAKSRLLESELKLERILEQQLANLSEAYFGVLNTKAALAIANQELESVESHHQLTTKRFAGGLVNKADVHESFSRAKVAKASQIDAKKAYQIAYNRLLTILQLERDEFTLPVVSQEAVNQPMDLPDVYELIEEHQTSNIEYRLQQQLVTSSRYALKADRAAMLPTLDLTASRSRTETEALEVGDELSTDDRRVMLELNIPLFKGFGNSAKSREAKYRYQAELIELDNVSNNVSLAIRNQYDALKSAFDKMQALEVAFDSSVTVLDLRQEGYIEGLVSNLDLLNAYRDKHRAETNWQEAVYAYLDAIVKLHIVLGQFDQTDIEHVDQFLSKQQDSL